jgi:hypothetical protein
MGRYWMPKQITVAAIEEQGKEQDHAKDGRTRLKRT